MLGGGPFDLPRGGWSDDTAMALCLAESLLGCEGFDSRDQVARYRRWQQEGTCRAPGSVSESPSARPEHSGSRNGGGSRFPAPTTPVRSIRKPCRASRRW